MMIKLYNKFIKYVFLFFIGGFTYGIIEIIYRGYSHISMFMAAGICFAFISFINETFQFDIPIISQMLASTIIITLVEFFIGLIVNMWLGLGVWDYSDLSYNVLGQISLLFTIIWFFLSLFIVLFDGFIKHYILGEEKRKYRMF